MQKRNRRGQIWLCCGHMSLNTLGWNQHHLLFFYFHFSFEVYISLRIMISQILLSLSFYLLTVHSVPLAGPSTPLPLPVNRLENDAKMRRAISMLQDRQDVVTDTGNSEAVFVYPQANHTVELSPSSGPLSVPLNAPPISSLVSSAIPVSAPSFAPPIASSSLPATALPGIPPAVNTSKPLVMAYYPDWVASTFPPEKIDFSRLDWIDFAFAIPTPELGLSWDEPAKSPQLLAKVVSLAHASGKKVKISIGGWSGSK
jgi:hypothetical protein